MKKLIFVDRDGTLIEEPEDEQVDSFEKLKFLPGVISGLRQLVQSREYELVMVSNQDGLGTETHPEENFWPVHNLMLSIFESEGIYFKEVLIDEHRPEDNAETRKPGIGLVKHYVVGQYDLEKSFMIGDRASDIQFAKNMGIKGIFIGKEKHSGAVFTADNWDDITDYIQNQPRTCIVHRNTKETDIRVELNLEGSGKAIIQTGLGFFDHMLEQIARHSLSDLKIEAKGDLHIDEHHTIEDVAITLGEAFYKALSSKVGIERYGFALPMDDCQAQVLIDFGGRPWLEWKAPFNREKVGEMPTEMFMHFFKSFSDTAKCNLNIQAEGENEHHKIEAIFKAFAKAIKMAKTRQKDSFALPSTKGVL